MCGIVADMDVTPSTTQEQSPRFADEAALVVALREGDDDAYEYLVRQFSPHLMAVLMRMLRNADEAADALQETFLQAFRAIGRFEGGSKLSTWLHRIAVNVALMRLRTRRRKPLRSIEDMLPRFIPDGHRADRGPAWSVTADDLLQRQEDREMVRQYIDELPDDYRTILLLRDIQEMNTEEAAEVLGITTGAVKTRLHRARQALRELLDPHMRV